MDAECTHDGSIKHVQKFEQWGWTTFQRRVLDAERTDDLTVLQVLKLACFPKPTYIFCLENTRPIFAADTATG